MKAVCEVTASQLTAFVKALGFKTGGSWPEDFPAGKKFNLVITNDEQQNFYIVDPDGDEPYGTWIDGAPVRFN